jgi:hypothetical protein
MPTLELHPLRPNMQFRLATFRYTIPVFDAAPDVVTGLDEIPTSASTTPETTATPQVPVSEGCAPGAEEETAARKGRQAR